MPEKIQGYRNISIPTGIIEQAETLLAELKELDFDTSYASIAEFVKDAVRRRIEQLRHTYLLGEPEEPPQSDH